MDASFVLVTQDLTQRVVSISRPRIVIGRHPDCYIRIPTSEVSRQHCEVVNEDDELKIRDLGSSNGTFVNRKKVSETTLKAGDLISVGSCVFVVRMDGEPESIDADEAYEDGHVSTSAVPPSSSASATSPTTVTKRPSSAPGAKPGKVKSVLDDEDKDNDDSDAFDFDFSDDDEDEKKKKPAR